MRTLKEVEEENARLRAALATSKEACAYCQLPAEEMAKCSAGFPGCARADDIVGCPEFGAMMELHVWKDEFRSLLLLAKASVSAYKMFAETRMYDAVYKTRVADFEAKLKRAEEFFGPTQDEKVKSVALNPKIAGQIARTDVVDDFPTPYEGRKDDRHEWREVGDGTPLQIWLETKREGEDGFTECFARIIEVGGQVEWIDREGYTTVTHSTFLPPTHWRFRINRFEELLDHLTEEGAVDGEFFGIPVYDYKDCKPKIKEGFQTIYDALKIASEQFKRK